MLALGLTMMLAPFSIDTYLPAFPRISEALGVSIQSVSLTVSFFVFSLALSQLLGGALSDRYGRRNVLMLGLINTPNEQTTAAMRVIRTIAGIREGRIA